MDLGTTYMGLKLSNPLVVSACPLSKDVANIARLEEAGAGAVVLYSLFEEQIEHDVRELDYYLEYGTERFAESLTYFPDPGDFPRGPEKYLKHIAEAKRAVDVPIIASLNGISAGGWTSYAQDCQQAGADALELNVYYLPTNPKVPSTRIEDMYLAVMAAVKATVSIPVAIKVSPYFSSTSNMLKRLDEAGADGLVLFNRFYQPDIDIRGLRTVSKLSLSTSAENRLPLRWIAILSGKLQASIAATTGIHTAEDVAKMLMAGADVTMLCSALLRNGPAHLSKIKAELVTLMQEIGYDSVSAMKGVMSQAKCPEPAAFERANYIKILQSYVAKGTLE